MNVCWDAEIHEIAKNLMKKGMVKEIFSKIRFFQLWVSGQVVSSEKATTLMLLDQETQELFSEA